MVNYEILLKKLNIDTFLDTYILTIQMTFNLICANKMIIIQLLV